MSLTVRRTISLCPLLHIATNKPQSRHITDAITTIGPLYRWLVAPLAESATYPEPIQANKDKIHTPRYRAAQQTLDDIAKDQDEVPMDAILTDLSINALAPKGLTTFIATATGTKDAPEEAQALVVQLVASHHASWTAFDELQQQAIANLYAATGLPQPPPHLKEHSPKTKTDPSARLWSSSAQRDASLECNGRTCQNQANAARTQGHQTMYHIPMLESLVCCRCRDVESDRTLLEGILEASQLPGLNDPNVKVWPRSDTHIFQHVKNLPRDLSARDVAGLSVIDNTSYNTLDPSVAAGQIHALTWLAYLRAHDPPKANDVGRHTMTEREIQRLCYAIPQQHRPLMTGAHRTALRIPLNMPSYPDPYLTSPSQPPQRCESTLCRANASTRIGKTVSKWRQDFQATLCARCVKHYSRRRLHQQLKQAAIQIKTRPIPSFLVNYAQSIPVDALMSDTCGNGNKKPAKLDAKLKSLKATTGALALVWMTHCLHLKTTDSTLENFFKGKGRIAPELWPKERPQPPESVTKKSNKNKNPTSTPANVPPRRPTRANQSQDKSAPQKPQALPYYQKNKRWHELKKAKMCSRGCQGWHQRPSKHVPSKEQVIDEIFYASKMDLCAILKARKLSTESRKRKISGHEIHRIHAYRLYDDIQKGHKLTETERQHILTYNDQYPHDHKCPMRGSHPGTAKRFEAKQQRPRTLPVPFGPKCRPPQSTPQLKTAGSRRPTLRIPKSRTPAHDTVAPNTSNTQQTGQQHHTQQPVGVTKAPTGRPPNAHQQPLLQQVQHKPVRAQPPPNWPPDPHL